MAAPLCAPWGSRKTTADAWFHPESASRRMDASSDGALVTLAGAPFGYVVHRLSETARSDC